MSDMSLMGILQKIILKQIIYFVSQTQILRPPHPHVPVVWAVYFNFMNAFQFIGTINQFDNKIGSPTQGYIYSVFSHSVKGMSYTITN